MIKIKKIKIASVFSGIGGFECGISQASKKTNIETEIVFSSEIDKFAKQTYIKNFGVEPHGDIKEINTNDIPDHDILCGGFPCQSFSIAGRRQGFEDTRGTLFFEIARILKGKQPRMFFLENVKGLLNHDKGKTFAKILQTVDELGYDAEWQVLNSKYCGVPQNRERVFIIGHLRGKCRGQIFPIISRNKLDNKTCKTKKQNVQTFRCLEAYEYKGYSSERFDGICQNNRVRRLTLTECERLQGFEDGWTSGVSNTQRYKQLGNAVTVNVIEIIACKILKSFKGID